MALREINLIPDPVLEQRYVTRHLAAWSGVLLAALLVIGGTYVLMAPGGFGERGIRKQLRTADRQLATTIAETGELQAELERFSLVTDLARHQPHWEILGVLAETMNEGVWLTKLSVETPEAVPPRNEVTMTGLAYSNAELGTFLSRLSATPMFTDVVLNFSKEKVRPATSPGDESVTTVTEFKINCSVPGT